MTNQQILASLEKFCDKMSVTHSHTIEPNGQIYMTVDHEALLCELVISIGERCNVSIGADFYARDLFPIVYCKRWIMAQIESKSL